MPIAIPQSKVVLGGGPSSQLDYHGPGVEIGLEDPGEIVTDRFALDTCTALFRTYASNYQNLPKIGDFHPIFQHLFIETKKVSLKGPYAYCSANFIGLDPELYPDGTTPVWELVCGTREEPIATHPNFRAFAGYPMDAAADVKNGAIWFDHKSQREVTPDAPTRPTTNAGHTFRRFQTLVQDTVNFGPEQWVLNPFAGMESYYDVCVTLRKTWFTFDSVPENQIRDVANISVPDEGNPYSAFFDENRNWFNRGVNSTQRGKIYANTLEWELSGRRGWNTDVYRQFSS
jgi:hypothetical protein